jgi:hypothetical protein
MIGFKHADTLVDQFQLSVRNVDAEGAAADGTAKTGDKQGFSVSPLDPGRWASRRLVFSLHQGFAISTHEVIVARSGTLTEKISCYRDPVQELRRIIRISSQ